MRLRFATQETVSDPGGLPDPDLLTTILVLNPKKKYNLEYYMDLVDKIVKIGTHILGIKDMAGVLKPKAATILVGSIRKKYPDLPIHVHTHDSAGTGVASMVACAQAGADAVDAASDSMSGMTSQPSIGAILASLEGSDLDPGLNGDNVRALDTYWQQLRLLYSPFEAGLAGPDPEVYHHEIPVSSQFESITFSLTQTRVDNLPISSSKPLNLVSAPNGLKPRKPMNKPTNFLVTSSRSRQLPRLLVILPNLWSPTSSPSTMFRRRPRNSTSLVQYWSSLKGSWGNRI